MTNRPDPHQVEPPTVPVRTFAVRRADDDLDSFVDTIIELVDHEATLVDLSHHDSRADVIELRVASQTRRSAS